MSVLMSGAGRRTRWCTATGTAAMWRCTKVSDRPGPAAATGDPPPLPPRRPPRGGQGGAGEAAGGARGGLCFLPIVQNNGVAAGLARRRSPGGWGARCGGGHGGRGVGQQLPPGGDTHLPGGARYRGVGGGTQATHPRCHGSGWGGQHRRRPRGPGTPGWARGLTWPRVTPPRPGLPPARAGREGGSRSPPRDRGYLHFK